MARYCPEHDVKLLSGTHLSVQVSIDFRITQIRISTITDTTAPVCFGRGSGEVRGAERSVTSGRPSQEHRSPCGLRDFNDCWYLFVCLCWTGQRSVYELTSRRST